MKLTIQTILFETAEFIDEFGYAKMAGAIILSFKFQATD